VRLPTDRSTETKKKVSDLAIQRLVHLQLLLGLQHWDLPFEAPEHLADEAHACLPVVQRLEILRIVVKGDEQTILGMVSPCHMFVMHKAAEAPTPCSD
jgi:hypothetical protein